jgi:hypothetical protein|nr:MAG TPA: replisome organizer [Caudoviricetes sp.]
MTYVPIEVDFYANPKFLDVSNAATGLWLKCAAWCKGYLTDGVIPLKMVRNFGGTLKQISDLVESGLWEESVENGQKTYLFHDWFDYNLPRKEVEKRRQKERDLKRKSRSQKRANQWKSENVRCGHPTDVRGKIALTLVQEEVQVKIKEEREEGQKSRATVAAPVARCPVPDAPSPSSQIEIGLVPDGVAPATAVGHSAALEPQELKPVGAPRPVVVDPQSAVEPAPAPVLEDPWAGLPDLACHQAVDTDCADGRVPSWLNPTSEKTATAKDQAVVAAVRAYQVIGTPAEWSSPDDPRCRKHAYLPREEVPPCRNCMRARQWFEQRADAEKQAHLAAIHACSLCDELGYVAVRNAAGETTGVAHCDHTGELPKPKAETQPRLTGRGMPAHLREKLDGILGRKTAQETAPEAPQKAETRGAHTDTPNHDPNLAEERSGELVAVGVAS